MTVVSQTSSGVRRMAKADSERRRHRLPGSRVGYAYVLPFFLVFLAFSVYPWLDTAWVSLHDTRLSTYHQSSFIGLENYRNLFTNQFFWNAFRNTITIGIISTVPQLCMALGIAHLLNYQLRGAHLLPGRDPDALRDHPRRRDRDLRRALRPRTAA